MKELGEEICWKSITLCFEDKLIIQDSIIKDKIYTYH